MDFPIYSGITTKRGIYYRYTIFSNHSVEVWKKVITPDLHNGDPTARKEKSIFVKPTKEIKENFLRNMDSRSANITINELRQRTGLSQGKFAKQYHLSVRTLQRWEQKQTETPEFVLFALKTILDLEERLNVKHSN